MSKTSSNKLFIPKAGKQHVRKLKAVFILITFSKFSINPSPNGHSL